MITNTCLTGGSFELEPPEAGVVDPPSPLPLPPPPAPLPPEPDGEKDLPEAGFVAAEGVLAGAVADGVGSELAVGGSLAVGEAASGVVVVAAAGAAGGRISFTCRPASAASVSCAGEAVTLPIRIPNPRNASTSTAQTRGDGSERSPMPTRSLARGRSE